MLFNMWKYMKNLSLNILVVGATGSIGQHVVQQALQQGHRVRALVRSTSKASQLPAQAEKVIGDVTQPETLIGIAQGIDAIVFTHGTHRQTPAMSETLDYGGVRNVLLAFAGQQPRVALMTAIGVTERKGSYNRSTQAHDWKRRAERLLRASGLDYTIVRPGWFDYNDNNQHKLLMLQGDRHHSGTPSDGVIARSQIAAVLLASLCSEAAVNKSFELVAEKGVQQGDLNGLFADLKTDIAGKLDAVDDLDNMPLEEEPERCVLQLQQMREQAAQLLP
jgi:uncharacterized protein YbjT (DUF2867 family)